MCFGNRIKISSASDYLHDANRALRRREYLNAIEKLNGALKDINEQKKSITKYLENQARVEKNGFQFSPENDQKLENLNNQLLIIQNEADEEVIKIKQKLHERLKNKEEFLTDYEIEIDITFFYGEDDPEYDENEDPILVELQCSDRIGDDEIDDWNDIAKQELPFNHCYLFHSLYGHVSPRLSWSDLLRIDSVWVDIEVRYQKKYVLDLKTGELVRDDWLDEEEDGIHYKIKRELD